MEPAQRESQASAPASPGRDKGAAYARPWLAFLVLAVAIFLTILDLFVVNVALPAIARDFPDASLSSLSWILTGYAVVFAAVLIPAGKLGDLYGRRRLFLAGLLLFVAGSALAAVATSLPILVAARAVQATGAAAVTPNSLGLALTLFSPQRRASVIAAWGGIAGLGAVAGPIVGALLAEVDWRWIFLVNLPLGLAALVLIPRMVREVRDARADHLPDGLGAGMLAIAIGLLVLAVSQTPGWGWGVGVVSSLLVTAGLTGAFLWRSARHPAPIVELPMLRVRSFAFAMVATFVFWAGFAAMLVASALFLTATWQFSIFEAGFALAPGPAISAVFAAASGRLGVRFGPTRVGMAGGGLFAVGGFWLAVGLSGETEYGTVFLPAQLLIGTGSGLMIPTLLAIALAELPPSRLSTGTAIYTTFRQIGTALGVAIWVATLGTSSMASASSFAPGWLFVAAMGVTACLAVAPATRRRARVKHATPTIKTPSVTST